MSLGYSSGFVVDKLVKGPRSTRLVRSTTRRAKQILYVISTSHLHWTMLNRLGTIENSMMFKDNRAAAYTEQCSCQRKAVSRDVVGIHLMNSDEQVGSKHWPVKVLPDKWQGTKRNDNHHLVLVSDPTSESR